MSAETEQLERLETLELAEAKRNGDVDRYTEIYAARKQRVQAEIDRINGEIAKGEADKAASAEAAAKVAAVREANARLAAAHNGQGPVLQDDVNALVADYYARLQPKAGK